MAGYKTPKRPRKTRRNPFMVTTGGQSVPYQPDELEGTWQATAKHAQRHEEKGTRYRVQKMQDGFWHIVDATTGQPTGKYGSTPDRAQQLLGKYLRRTNPKRSYVASTGTGYGEEYVTVVKAKSAKAARRAMGSAAPSTVRKVPRGSHEYEMILSDEDFPYHHHRPARSLKELKAEAASRGFEVDQARRMTPGSYRFIKPNPSPVPGISVEEVIADIDGQEWANWDLNRAGIMHWRANPRRR